MQPVTGRLRDLSVPTVMEAIRANWAAYYMHLGSVPGVELASDRHLSWLLTGIPDAFLNVVFRTDLPPERAADIVDRALVHFRSRQIPVVSWHTPGALAGEILASRGLTFDQGGTAMAADLADLPVHGPAPDGLAIAEVEDRSGLAAWVHVMRIGFEDPEQAEPGLLDLYDEIGAGPRLRTYLALLDGRPVATSQLFFGAGVAGIYMVTCLPDARGQGIGRAITLAPLLEARRRGYRIAILQASDLGYPVYRRLGFRGYGRLDEYRFTLGSPAGD